jgi:hypothetical protein
MKRTLGAALAVALSLLFTAGAASAGYDYDFYSGADLYVARSHTPVYDRPFPGGYTNIRLRGGSYIYASCWGGYYGWCQIRTRYFKNMFVPRYALDSAYSYRYQSYYDNGAYNDCAYRESYPYRYGGYREGCFDKYDNPYKGPGYRGYGVYKYGGGFGYRYGVGNRYGGYGYKRSYYDDYKGDGYSPDDYKGEGYDQD